MLSLKERMELDLEARLMGETLVLHRSLDPFFEDYIELNDLNVTLELRRDQVDELMPTIKKGELVKEFRARNDARMQFNLHSSGIVFLQQWELSSLAVETSDSGNSITGSGNALCILFPTILP
nr:hypothetical protein [Tanacetum cinerariifolium]